MDMAYGRTRCNKRYMGNLRSKREGLAMTMLSDWDYVNVRDFKYLNELWAGRDTMPEDVVHEEIFRLGSELQNELDVPIAIQSLDAIS